MSVRYIGSKSRVAKDLVDLLGPPPAGARFIDAFCGTGVVASAAADTGWPVTVNDMLESAVILTRASLLAKSDVPFAGVGSYEAAIRQLNAVRPKPGFVHAEYSPASRARVGIERRYFTEENAARIDAVRARINRWLRTEVVTETEGQLLIADLIFATNRVANIAGTYGCFLRSWSAQARRNITLTPRQLRAHHVDHAAQCGDVFDVAIQPGDVAYFDPPYTKRQYAAYYHLLETIAVGDEPVVEGVAGLRPWRAKASPFCYKTRALRAIVDLLMASDAQRVLLSYSDEGHVVLRDLVAALEDVGTVVVHTLGNIGRYRPNEQAAQRRDEVVEYVVEFLRDPVCEYAAEESLELVS